MYRDFTYIEDLIRSIYKLIPVSPKALDIEKSYMKMIVYHCQHLGELLILVILDQLN